MQLYCIWAESRKIESARARKRDNEVYAHCTQGCICHAWCISYWKSILEMKRKRKKHWTLHKPHNFRIQIAIRSLKLIHSFTHLRITNTAPLQVKLRCIVCPQMVKMKNGIVKIPYFCHCRIEHEWYKLSSSVASKRLYTKNWNQQKYISNFWMNTEYTSIEFGNSIIPNKIEYSFRQLCVMAPFVLFGCFFFCPEFALPPLRLKVLVLTMRSCELIKNNVL